MYFEGAPDGKSRSRAAITSPSNDQQPGNGEYHNIPEAYTRDFDEFVNSSNEQDHMNYTSDDDKNEDGFQSNALVNANDIDILTSSRNTEPPSNYNTYDEANSATWLRSNTGSGNDTYTSYPTYNSSHGNGPLVTHSHDQNLHTRDDDDDDDDNDSSGKPQIV
jgi:hypothetical protein